MFHYAGVENRGAALTAKTTLGAFWGLLLLTPCAFAEVSKADALAREAAQTHAKQALERASSPQAVADLARLHQLREEVDDLNLLAEPYATLMNRESAHPAVRKVARVLYADVERARGHLVKSRTVLEPLGFVQNFYVVGGFDNEGKRGCEVEHGPATAQDLQTVYAGKKNEVSWHRVPFKSLDGYVDLGAFVRPTKESVAYAMTFLEASQEGPVTFWLGTSGASRLYVNGKKVLSDDIYRVPRMDQIGVKVSLRQGLNKVVLKVCQDQGPFGFFLRATGSASLKVVLPTQWSGLDKGPVGSAQPQPSVAQALKQLVDQRPSDAALRADYATVLAFTQSFDKDAHTDAKESAAAALKAPNQVNALLLAASLENDDRNLRRGFLEKAYRLAPTSPEVQWGLARHELDSGHPERAWPLLNTLLQNHPTFTRGRILLLQTLEALGERARATVLLSTYLRDSKLQFLLMKEGAHQARRMEKPMDAVHWLRAAIALRFDDNSLRKLLASILSDLGDIQEASNQIQWALALDPFDNDLRLRAAELFAANGKLPQAHVLFEQALELAPEDAEVHERQGRAWLLASETSKARASFHRALALRPQNPALRELLRKLDGETASYGSAYVLDVKALEAEADARYAKEDAVYLVDSSYTHVQPSGQASRSIQVGIKVYTARGVEAFRQFPISYSPARQEVHIVRARIRKPDGSVVDGYSDAERNVNEPWTGMYYDLRSKQLSFSTLGVGDILEVQYRIDDTAEDNLLSDYWGEVDYVQGTYVKLRYQFLVDMPKNRPLYWNKTRLGDKVVSNIEAVDEGRSLYRFTAAHVEKIVPESGMPGWAEVATTLHVSTYKTWEDVGRYYWGLVRDQLVINDELKKTVQQVLKNVDKKNEKAVIQAIYNFVVTHTRYVALEFGIHGYKPYRVDRILARRFGDCKDKASLIYTMLKVAGVEARLVLLRMRNLGDIGEEPASLAAFNHAIAYVPKYQLFLDGTAEFFNSEELPSSDRAANILIVEPNAPSVFSKTPEAAAADNASSVHLKMKLSPDGDVKVLGQTRTRGQEAPMSRRAYQSASNRKQTFEQSWAQLFPGLRLENLEISDVGLLDAEVETRFQFEASRYGEASNGTLRFYAFGGKRSFTQSFGSLRERKFDLLLQYPFSHTFRYEYELPLGYTLKEAAYSVTEASAFGSLSMRLFQENEKWVAEGSLDFSTSRIEGKDYAAFRAWLLKLDEAFARKLTATTEPAAAKSARGSR